MSGALVSLGAFGAQDIYLTSNPQITFFKIVYRRYTNFATEEIEQTFNGTPDFGKSVTAIISRNGDLIQQMYLEVLMPTIVLTDADDGDPVLAGWIYGVGNALVRTAEIEIGGTLVDRQHGEWMNIWTELSTPAAKRVGYDDMVGNWWGDTQQNATPATGGASLATTAKRLYIPLQFWFNTNPGLALPLIALQYHEVKLKLTFRDFNDLWVADNAIADTSVIGTVNIKLYVNYIFLDTDERRRFAQVSHEYLIKQVQFTGDESIAQSTTSKNVTLNFNHPVAELIWVHVTNAHATSAGSTLAGHAIGAANNWLNFSGAVQGGAVTNTDSFTQCKLQLNGHDRFSVRPADYFRKVQPFEHHTQVPRAVLSERAQYIYVYSFALSPEEHQPSGTCNFSRIDNAIMQLTYTNNVAQVLKVYAVNYNILRIMSGMGGMAYAS
jgi:hypothetical protein